jgi:autotransporter-associated beta strand protein
MDIAGLTVDEIRFTGAKNTINGSQTLTINGATLAQNVVSEGAENTLGASLAITLVGASCELTSSTGTLTLSGPFAGSPGLVFVGSGGSFDLYDENTYQGATAVESGTVHIAAPVGLVIKGSSITVGSGVGPGAELALEQSADISKETEIVINSDGVFNFNGHADSAKSLTVNHGLVHMQTLTMTGPLVMSDGSLSLEGTLLAGSLSMHGGTISTPGSGSIFLAGNIQASSSASGPATVSAGLRLNASPVVNVTPGTAPELRLTGPISELGASRGLTKSGTGTLLTTGADTYTGPTTVSEGTLVADGTQPGQVTVEPGGTLTGSGTVGETLVNGVLAPTPPGLTTGSLSFGATGSLDETVTSLATGTVPSAIASGAVTIASSAALNVSVPSGTATPTGSQVKVIDNRSALPISGQFSGFPAGSVLTSGEGVPLAVSYTGGDGNDLSLTAENAAPPASPQAQTAAPAATTGQPRSNVPATSTASASGFGATFALTYPHGCLRAGSQMAVRLSVRKLSKVKTQVLARVVKVTFAIVGKSVETIRSSPFRALLTIPRGRPAGSTVKVHVAAYLVLRHGGRRTKSFSVPVALC